MTLIKSVKADATQPIEALLSEFVGYVFLARHVSFQDFSSARQPALVHLHAIDGPWKILTRALLQ